MNRDIKKLPNGDFKVQREFREVRAENKTMNDYPEDPIFDFMIGELPRRIRREYRKQHKCCPKCGSTHDHQTLRGTVLDMNKPEEYMDDNESRCQDCGWVGTVHDRVQEKES